MGSAPAPQSDIVGQLSAGDARMSGIAKLFVLLALLTFIVAVIGAYTGTIMGIGAEAFSRACTNLALLAIAIVLVFKEEASAA